MSCFRFWVPFNGDFMLLEKLKDQFAGGVKGNRIEGIYFPAPQEYFGSARVVEQFTIDDAKKIIEFCNNNGFKTNMLLNSSCEGAEWYSPQTVSKTLFIVKKMKELGLSGITLTNPIYIQKIKKEHPDLKVTASVICEIDSVQRARFFEELGADAFVPERDINRDLELLKEIKDATEMEMTLMVNEGCLYRCPQRMIHYNFVSHWSKLKNETYTDFMSNYCVAIRGENPEELLKSPFMLPQHLKFYRKIAKSFKIVGRVFPTLDLLRTTRVYLEESFHGNLLDILSGSIPITRNKYGFDISAKALDNTFFRKVTTCNKNCTKCEYCKNLVKNIL